MVHLHLQQQKINNMNKTDKILEKLGIAELNEMQKEAVEAILHHRNDVIILSPTGSGKTVMTPRAVG